MKRIFLVVLDSVGIGEMPDAGAIPLRRQSYLVFCIDK